MNWYRDYLPAEQLVLDASVLINVLGCGASESILQSLHKPAVVENRTLREVCRHPQLGRDHKEFFESAICTGILEKTTMSDGEYETYLTMVQASLGTRLGDGESAALAVASHRKLSVVMDEKKGRNYAGRHFPEVQVVSSLKLLISAAARLDKGVAWAQAVITSAHTHARLSAPKDESALLCEVLGINITSNLNLHA